MEKIIDKRILMPGAMASAPVTYLDREIYRVDFYAINGFFVNDDYEIGEAPSKILQAIGIAGQVFDMGHAFVRLFAKSMDQTITEGTCGFYPLEGNGLTMLVTGTKGGVKNDKHGLEPSPYSNRYSTSLFEGQEHLASYLKYMNEHMVLRVKVPRAVYEQAVTEVKRWIAEVNFYKLFDQDCVTFAATIAKKIGLVIPSRASMTPHQYLYALMLAN